ncbi:radical SAM family heme chaperone HemW [Pectinatus sottacetonis]|uniref:radical SAM family heme chaperone HemW n=1 Tax=Pectinatus sottacetonis TaxID=1002795 RepID=UPI0018C4B0B8|nr:radical SAM family heme chaperone HemW [Pectinatus sottacetonis]
MYSLYIHIPFCKQKCRYCDFPSITAVSTLYPTYTNALVYEISLRRRELGAININTIYFGGGTPSLMPINLVTTILKTIYDNFTVSNNCEITLEANPGTIDFSYLHGLKQIGVNRLSLGIQSIHNNLLKILGRIHTFQDADITITNARKAGFDNISIDLMYGLPTQTMPMLQESLTWAVARDIQHISVYGLQIEPNTPFYTMCKSGQLSLPDEVLVEKMYDYINNFLPQNNFHRYEISNFAKKNFASRHNSAYWQDKPYIGLGCAAHSYYKQKRFYNTHNVNEYISQCLNDTLTYEQEEILDKKSWMEEFCFLRLRMTEGINKNEFYQKFHCNIYSVYAQIINKFITKNLLTDTGTFIKLTPLGMKYGNIVFEGFLL